MHPADVEQRLTALSELLQLSASLETASGALLAPGQLARRALVLASPAPWPASVESSPTRAAFRASSGTTTHVGAALSGAFVPGEAPLAMRPVAGVLVAVVSAAGLRLDSLPAGVEATVVLEFPAGLPELAAPQALVDARLSRLLPPG